MTNGSAIAVQIRDNVIYLSMAIIIVLIISGLLSKNTEDIPHYEYTARGGISNGTFVNNEWMSLEVYKITKNNAELYNVTRGTKGVVVGEVEGNADVAMKLRKGDVITAVNNKKVKNLGDIRKALNSVNAAEGMFCDIQRGGYPMYITLSGNSQASNNIMSEYLNPHPFTMAETAPFMQRDINIGGVKLPPGALGKPIEEWIAKHEGKNYYSCYQCGTMVPKTMRLHGKIIACPNCAATMMPK